MLDLWAACDVEACRIPRTHEHQPERYEETTWTLYWCEHGQEWTECSGPCPDGTPHSLIKIETKMTRVIPTRLLEAGNGS